MMYLFLFFLDICGNNICTSNINNYCILLSARLERDQCGRPSGRPLIGEVVSEDESSRTGQSCTVEGRL
jgi:hypothetical protein